MSPDPFPTASPFGDPGQPPSGPLIEPPPTPRAPLPAAAIPPKTSSRRRWPAILAGVAAAVLVAGISFAGGYEVGQGGVPSSGAAGLGDGGFGRFGNGLGGSGAPGGRFGQGRGTGAGGTAGTISSVAPDQLTVSVASGGSKLVLVDSSTTVTKISSTDEALTDLSQGESITVVGTTNPDGSVTAMQIIVGQADGLFGPPGQRRGPGGSPLPTAGP